MHAINLTVKFQNRSLEFFYGNIALVISESNEIDYKDEIHTIHLDNKKESKMSISCRGKFRKTVNQKKYGEEDVSMDGSMSQVDTRRIANPALWIKDNQFLKKVDIKQSETLLLIQLTKENNPMVILSILRQLEMQPSQMVLNTLCELIEQREFDPIIQKYMAKMVLRMSSNAIGWRGLDKLINILKKLMIEDDMVLSNDFSKKYEHFFILAVIKYSSKLKDSKMLNSFVVSDNNIAFFIRLLEQNDNSMQIFIDAQYRGELLRAIMHSNNPNFLKKILHLIFAQLQSEVAMVSEFNVILKMFLANFSKFLKLNDITCKNTQFSETLNNIKKKIKILVNKSDVEINSIYFKYKLHMKQNFYIWSNQKTLIYAIQKMQKKKLFSQSSMAKVIEIFVQKNQTYFQEEYPFKEPLEKQKKLAEILWEQLVCGVSLVNGTYRQAFINVYRNIYFHFTPLGFKNDFFPLDMNWISQQQLLSQENTFKSTNIVNLRFLNLNKRKKGIMEKQKVNPRDMLLSYFKNSRKWIENLSWKSLSRSILHVFSQEKNTETIEKDILDEVLPMQKSEDPANPESQVLKLKVNSQLSMRLIKKRLQKEYYENIDQVFHLFQVEEEVYEVINNYRNKGLMDEMIYSEYQELVECIFQEARLILEDKANGKIRNQTIKMPKIKMLIEGNQISFNNGERERQQKLMEKEKMEYLKKKVALNPLKINLKMDQK